MNSHATGRAEHNFRSVLRSNGQLQTVVTRPAAVRPSKPRHLPTRYPRIIARLSATNHRGSSSRRRAHDPRPGKTRSMSTHTCRSIENRVRYSLDSGQPLKSGTVTAVTPGRRRGQHGMPRDVALVHREEQTFIPARGVLRELARPAEMRPVRPTTSTCCRADQHLPGSQRDAAFRAIGRTGFHPPARRPAQVHVRMVRFVPTFRILAGHRTPVR